MNALGRSPYTDCAEPAPPLVLAATARGSGHAVRGEPCQDAFAWARLSDGGVALALADGAGSAAHAEMGARAAVDAAVASGTDPARAVNAARQAVSRRAEDLGVPPRALACTIIVAVWDQGRVTVAHVGDGAVVGRRDGEWLVLSGPEPTEYVNETCFLTDRRPRVRISAPVDGLEGLVAFTDGCQRAALRGVQPFAGFLDPLARFAAAAPDPRDGARALFRLLESTKLRAVSDDDKTLAVIWQGPEV